MSQRLTFKEKLLQIIVPPLATAIIKILGLTMKIEVLHGERVEKFWEEDRRMILAFWHSRLLMIPFCYHGRGIRTLISQHKDGELLARTMRWFGHESIRGSTTRGGTAAMRGMVKALKECDIALTPDGPKGPRCRAQEGAIVLARLTGVPIVPVTFGASRKKVFASWDAFNLPYPFSRGAFLWGEPLHVEKGADLEAKRRELEERLNSITDEVDRYLRDQ